MNRRIFLFSGLPGFIAGSLLLAEFSVRQNRPDLEIERHYRAAHCFEESHLVLCPSIRGRFLRPDGSYWTMTTDHRGERIVPASKPGQPEVWWIGDSISMGYLLDDDKTAPYISGKYGYNVRNLGSDSLGTKGIAFRLKQALKTVTAPPRQIFWIYNTSDFVDDVKDLRFESDPLYRLTFRMHYALSQRSALYLLLRSRPADMNQLPPGFDKAPPEDHPTFTNLKSFSKELASRGIPLTILVYPGMNPETGSPGIDDPTTASLIDFLVRNRILQNGLPVFDVIDLRQDFIHLQAGGRSPYMRHDGHPDEIAAQLFAEKAHRYMKQFRSIR
jgi:hypothetical protein